MKKSLLLLALLSTCGLPPPAYSHHGNLPQHLDKDKGPLVNEVEQQLFEVNYPTLFLLQWTYQCSQQMQPQFEYQGMPKPLALQFSIQNCSCVIDEFRKHYRYEHVLEMSEPQKLQAAEEMTKECLIGVNTDRNI
jgi:hypothetical protein